MQTIKVWKKTLKLIRLTCAITDETIVHLLDRLVREEYEKVKDKIFLE